MHVPHLLVKTLFRTILINMASYEQTRNLKKLSLKLRYLREENQDIQDDLDVGKQELNLAVFESFARAGQKINTSNAEQEPQEPVEDQNAKDEHEDLTPDDPVCKKLFRKIAVIAHPDKLLNIDDEEKTHLTDLYAQAAAANKTGDRSTLIEIAASLNIPIDIDPDLQIAAMTERVNALEKSIDETRQTLPYMWIKSKDDTQRRAAILRSIITRMGLNIPDEIINDVLQWITAGFPGGTSYGAPVEIPSRNAPPPRAPGVRPEKMPKRRK